MATYITTTKIALLSDVSAGQVAAAASALGFTAAMTIDGVAHWTPEEANAITAKLAE